MKARKINKTTSWDWRMGVVIGLVILVVMLLGYRAIQSSQIWGQNYRYNLVLASPEGGVRFVSFDPQERKTLIISWPEELEIKSRSVGSYQVGDLYKLGEYEHKPGEMVRRKTQGFMKIPLMGYIESDSGLGGALFSAVWKGEQITAISRLDAVILWLRNLSYETETVTIAELVRAGVLEDTTDSEYTYQAGRLQQYLGERVVDWGVGEVQVTVAIVNESGMTGIATDVASFLTNVGMDVVAVRSGEKIEDLTRIGFGQIEEAKMMRTKSITTSLFGWSEYGAEGASEYRAEMIIRLGKDAATLF